MDQHHLRGLHLLMDLPIRETTVLLPQSDRHTSAIVCPGLTDIDKSSNTLTSGRVW